MGQHTIRIDKLVGSVMRVEDMESKRQFINEARARANQYDWLFHCTHKESLLGIIRSRKFWLTNLKLVNDIEESERIDDSDYEKSFFIASFTYEDNVYTEHWEEYGNQVNGVLFGVKREWFQREMRFMTQVNQELEDEHFRIYSKPNLAFNAKIDSDLNKGKIIYPYETFDYGFYQVVYDDDLMKNIQSSAILLHNGDEIHGRFISPEIAGIIKHTNGYSRREGQEPRKRNWIDEKEVRLKIGVRNQYTPFKEQKELWFHKLSVALSPEAFSDIIIRFSPYFPEAEKQPYLELLQQEIPSARIEIL